MTKKSQHTIGIDARMYGAEQTGIGVYIEYLIKNLLEIDQENFYKIFLLESEFSRFNDNYRNARKIKVNSRWYSWREQLVLPWQMMRERIDLMHFPHFNAPILYRGKFITTIHDLTPLRFPGRKMGGSSYRKKAFKYVFSNAVRRASKVIAVSNYTKNDLIQNFGVNEDKVRVIYEGVRKLKAKPLSANQVIVKPYIFYTGVWREHKNLIGLIKAFNILIKKYHMDLWLVLGGKEDPYYPDIRTTWEELGLQNRVVTPGFLTDEELTLFYKNASLFVIPSFAEGFGFVGLEAMACGAPVVASSIMSLPEILGNAAIYFNPYDVNDIAEKIREVLTKDILRRDLIQKGYENIKKYSWRKMAEETLQLYKNILCYNK